MHRARSSPRTQRDGAAPAPPRADPAVARLLGLQRTAGNALVARAVGRGAVLQRREVQLGEDHTVGTDEMTLAQIYALIGELSAAGNEDAVAALLAAIRAGEYDDDYDPAEEAESTDDDVRLSERDRSVPASVYTRYVQHHRDTAEERKAKAQKGKGRAKRFASELKESSLRQNTTALAIVEGPPRRRDDDSSSESESEDEFPETREQAEHGIEQRLYGQRVYPVMPGMAEENMASLEIARGVPNIHAEMYALLQTMHRLLDEGVHEHILEIHPSNPVCFFCEVMLRLFGVRYDETYVSKSMHGKWKDPSAWVADDEHPGGYTPAEMLEAFGLDEDEAVERILPLFADLDDPESFARRVLNGELSGRDLARMIKDLKAGSETLAKANATASTKRKRRTGTTKRSRKRTKKEPAPEMETEEAVETETVPSSSDAQHEEPDLDADPVEIEGVGQLVDVPGDGLNCLIAAILEAGDIDFDAEVIRQHLVQQHVAGFAHALDLAGVAGGVLLSFLAGQNPDLGQRGLVVHFWNIPGVLLGQRVVVEGPNPLHLWLSNGHFQAIKP